MLTKEQKKLAEDHIQFAYYQSHRLHKQLTFLDYDDVLSLCQHGLLYATKHFKENKGYSFTTYSGMVMKNEVYKYVRYLNAQKRKAPTVSLNHTLDDRELLELIGGQEDKYEWETTETVSQLMKCLTVRERQVITLRFYHDMTNIEIAELIGTIPNNISKTMQNALKKMRERGEELE